MVHEQEVTSGARLSRTLTPRNAGLGREASPDAPLGLATFYS